MKNLSLLSLPVLAFALAAPVHAQQGAPGGPTPGTPAADQAASDAGKSTPPKTKKARRNKAPKSQNTAPSGGASEMGTRKSSPGAQPEGSGSLMGGADGGIGISR